MKHDAPATGRSLTLTFESWNRARRQLSMVWRVGDLRFTTSFWYDSVDLPALEATYGRQAMERIYFHIMAYEGLKLCSLRPDAIDLGDFARFHTRSFEAAWRTTMQNVWQQWRYENDDPDYAGPTFTSTPVADDFPLLTAPDGPAKVLSFCGGGKDSIVALKLLERAGIPHDSFVYSSSAYGMAEPQHRLSNKLLDHATPERRHAQWIYDDFMDSPVLQLNDRYRTLTLTAAETPTSLMACLPIALTHGHQAISLGHERSADTGQVVWQKTGEDINHQWGKSFAAEQVFNSYLAGHLVSNYHYFSLLKPIYDTAIFNLLRRDLNAVPATHSCNIDKPWCKRCPKCAYVWLNYMAWLPVDLVRSIFHDNLFDLAENQIHFRQLLGLEDQLPFECIGQRDEVRLAFEMCRLKGLTGKAMDVFKAEVGRVDVDGLLDRYLDVAPDLSAIPAEIRQPIIAQMRAVAGEARAYVADVRAAALVTA